MYELWLFINMLWEWVLLYPILPIIALIALALAYGLNRKGCSAMCQAWRGMSKWWLILSGLVFVVFPLLIQSSVFELRGGFMDWFSHGAFSVSLGALLTLVLGPFLAKKIDIQ